MISSSVHLSLDEARCRSVIIFEGCLDLNSIAEASGQAPDLVTINPLKTYSGEASKKLAFK